MRLLCPGRTLNAGNKAYIAKKNKYMKEYGLHLLYLYKDNLRWEYSPG